MGKEEELKSIKDDLASFHLPAVQLVRWIPDVYNQDITKKTVRLPKGNIPTYEFKRTKKIMFQLLTNILNPTRWFVILTSKQKGHQQNDTQTPPF